MSDEGHEARQRLLREQREERRQRPLVISQSSLDEIRRIQEYDDAHGGPPWDRHEPAPEAVDWPVRAGELLGYLTALASQLRIYAEHPPSRLDAWLLREAERIERDIRKWS